VIPNLSRVDDRLQNVIDYTLAALARLLFVLVFHF
jgi:hypothetical protein